MSEEKKVAPRAFEPPPWEREAFEALARKRAEEQAALEALAAAERAASGSEAATAEALAAEVLLARAAMVPPTEAGASGADAPAGDAPPAEPAQPAAPAVDDRQVQVMLMELGREETTPARNVQLIARIAAVITGLIGAGMLAGGIFALQKAGGSTVGVMGSGALSVFGMCFFGMAAWVWVRSNRVRGSH